MAWSKSTVGQEPADNLKKEFFAEDHANQSILAIDSAFKQGREDLLLIGLDNPVLGNKQYAAEMLCLLPQGNISSSLIKILEQDRLWIKQENGGRNLVLQEQFVDAIRDALNARCHINVASINFFDSTSRRGLVQLLKKGSQ